MKNSLGIISTLGLTVLACALVYMHKQEIDRLISTAFCKVETKCKQVKKQIDEHCQNQEQHDEYCQTC